MEQMKLAKIASILLVMSAAGIRSDKADKLPNIIFILADDMVSRLLSFVI